MQLSGNFGELRPNHFHAGFDYKTQQREGLKVYASAEGYVSRIKISKKQAHSNKPLSGNIIFGDI